MNIKLASTFLLGATVLLVAPVRADRIRTGSSYGMAINSQTSSIGTQTLVPLTPLGPTEGDLVLQISPTSPDLGDAIQVKITLSSTEFVMGTGTFGVVNCPGFNLGSLCTPASNPTCNLSGVTYQGGSLTLPGSCDVANETFYFDEPATTDDFSGTFADISAVTPTTTPEPSSLALLSAGLFSLALLSKRLLQS